MATLEEVKAAAQAVVDSLNTLEVAPAATTVTEVDVKESDGTEEKFVPEVA